MKRTPNELRVNDVLLIDSQEHLICSIVRSGRGWVVVQTLCEQVSQTIHVDGLVITKE